MSTTRPTTIDELFGAFGGPYPFGRAIGVTGQHAGTMKRRKSIHMRHWKAVIQACKDRKITLCERDLVAIHENSSGVKNADTKLAATRASAT